MNSLAEFAKLLAQTSTEDGVRSTTLAGVTVIRASRPSLRIPIVYRPSVCLLARGHKRVLLDGEIYRYRSGEFLGISVDLPIVGQVTKASKQEPYLCLQIELDSMMVAEASEGLHWGPASPSLRGLFVGKMAPELLESAVRWLRLTGEDAPGLEGLRRKEFYYWLLRSEHGATIASLARVGTHLQRLRTVFAALREEPARSFAVGELAAMANMSPSSFHAHFKQLTAMSPLQYQKRVRLIEARRLLLEESCTAAAAAYQVGYESPSQFSREYARFFGAPPIRDVHQMARS